jgi:hypothetical protein
MLPLPGGNNLLNLPELSQNIAGQTESYLWPPTTPWLLEAPVMHFPQRGAEKKGVAPPSHKQ